MKRETFAFDPAFDVEVDPPFPGDGNWGIPAFRYNAEGEALEGDEVFGLSSVVRFRHPAGDWVGRFGRVRRVCATPNADHCVVVSGWSAVLVQVAAPREGLIALLDDVQQVAVLPEPPVLLLCSSIALTALGPTGRLWTSERLALDDLRVTSLTRDSVTCTADLGIDGAPSTVVVDLRTGKVR